MFIKLWRVLYYIIWMRIKYKHEKYTKDGRVPGGHLPRAIRVVVVVISYVRIIYLLQGTKIELRNPNSHIFL